MANIILRIEVNSDAETELLGDTFVDSVAKVNNVGIKPNASGKYETMPTRTDGIAGLSFATGFLKFDINGMLCNADGKPGFLQSEENPIELMWGATNDSGEYSVTLTFSDADNLDKIVIYGDKNADQFPTEAILDGNKTITSDDNVWAIKFDEPASTHTIQFTKWNRPNYNACITLIHVMLRYLDLNKRYIKNLDTLSQSTPNAKEIIYGALANTGKADITDINGEIADYIEDGIIPQSNVPIEIFLNGGKVQSHIIDDMDYDTNSKVFSIDIKNDLYKLVILEYGGYFYEGNPQNAFVILSNILESIGYTQMDIDTMLGSKTIYNSEIISIKEYLQLISIEYPSLPKASFQETLNKFCRLAQLNLYCDDSNQMTFISARPIILSEDIYKTISIPKSKQFSVLNITKILKNRYDGVEIYEKEVNSLVNYDALLDKIETSIISPIFSSPGKYQHFSISGGSFGNYDIHLRIDSYYASGTIKIYKNRDFGLNKINKISADVKYSTNYTKNYTGDGEGALKKDPVTYLSNITSPINKSTLRTEYYSSFWNPTENSDTGNTKIPEDSRFLYDNATKTFIFKSQYKPNDAKIQQTDNSSISIVENEDSFDITYNILVGVFCTNFESPPVGDFIFPYYEYIADSINVSIYGDERVISFKDISVSTENIKDAITPVNIQNSEILQSNTKISNNKISTIIKNNILSDYKDGVADGTITVCCSDLYTINGEKAKDFKKGEILQVGDLITFEQTPNRVFRITGRKLRYEGQPLIDLEFIEVKVVD